MYLPFARKWRPQDFDEIVGQEHITTTLKNAILMNRLHHAYLFAGPRGIGKTSTARIFSKAINCEKGPAPAPCNKCITCQEITSGTSMDVIEIDGASNRGIDEVRNLRETIKFAPSKCRYKIYIIDEVHMLTLEAFNALLKTLEEPPLHVKFIFATTEPHKVPATILSRCQRFDFRLIQTADIVAKLNEVAKEEKIDMDKDGFLYIAKAAEGSMRDAESILDQIASFSNGKININNIIESLGLIGEEVVFKSIDCIINKDTKGAIYLVNDILNSGKDVKQFLLEILEYTRNMMIVNAGVLTEDVLNLPKDTIARIAEKAKKLSQQDIFYIINVVSNSLKLLKQQVPARIVAELCMVRLTLRESIVPMEEILAKLSDKNKGPDKIEPVPVPVPNIAVQKTEPKEEHKPQVSIFKKLQDNIKEKVAHKANSDANPVVELNKANDAWPILIKTMAVRKMSVSTYLAESKPDSIKGNIIMVAFPKDLNFHREILEEKNNKDAIEATLSQILDVKVRINFILVEARINNPGKALPAGNEPVQAIEKDPVLGTALDIFGGRVL